MEHVFRLLSHGPRQTSDWGPGFCRGSQRPGSGPLGSWKATDLQSTMRTSLPCSGLWLSLPAKSRSQSRFLLSGQVSREVPPTAQ